MLRKLIVAGVLAASGAYSTAMAQPAETCSVMVRVDGKLRTEAVSGYVVSGAPTPLRLPDGYAAIVALSCERPKLAIGDNDYRVLIDLGVPLFVRSGDRIMSVEIVDGRLEIRFVRGALTQDEETDIQSALNRAQSLLQNLPQ
ncbi:MAG: hypothetical protein QM773_10050 [Hyphomonadaceae bacterium]